MKNCYTVVMLEKKAHSLRGSIVPALLLLVGSCALQSRAAAFPDWTDCPAVCRCKWTSGKKSALCPDAGLENLPATLDPDMQVLDLSGNRILSLQSEIFKRVGLVNLQRVFLRNAGIREIHADSFRGMGILIEVDLSDNHLKALEPDTFHGNERLRILVLSGNPLVTLKSHQFPQLQHLRTLELQRCSLKEIHPLALAHLGGLESLKLDGNQLEYLDSRVITCLVRLTTLTLESNDWICDCRLRNFRSWLVDNNGVPQKIYGTSQICRGPARLRGRHWESVKPTEFACEPKVSVQANTIQEEVSGNLSLTCSITGDPEPEVWWQLNGASLNASRVEQTFSSSMINSIDDFDTNNANRINEKWNNLTIYNATDADAGEYTCFAKNVAGTASDVVNIVVPRVFSAPTLSQTDNWYLWVSLAGGGAAALCASLSAVILVICMCGSTRRKRTREKVKLQSSGSYGDQEKKLLDLSVTTTTGGSGNGNDRSSGRASLAETCSPGDLELTERGSICDPIAAASVTVERLRPECNVPSGLRAIPCTNVFPPPPPEFTTGVLPAGIFGNIFISVSLPQDSERCYPDLLDIPVHSSTIPDKFNIDPHPSSSMVSSYATLPRRSMRSTDLGSPYDNMGPRVTATGSSTFSLTDDLRLSPPPPPRIIKPPIEFVSL